MECVHSTTSQGRRFAYGPKYFAQYICKLIRIIIYTMFVAQKSEKYISKFSNAPSSLRDKMLSLHWLKRLTFAALAERELAVV